MSDGKTYPIGVCPGCGKSVVIVSGDECCGWCGEACHGDCVAEHQEKCKQNPHTPPNDVPVFLDDARGENGIG